MRLTIIPSDNAVGKDGLFYLNIDISGCNIPSNVHALQWQDNAGWIEFNNNAPNEPITALPDWATFCVEKWDQENNKPIPDPLPPTAEENKKQAMYLLQTTDWTTIPDVGDPAKSNPYLGNVDEFIAYRNEVRQYAINPIEGYISWPVAPQENWITSQ